VAALLALVAFAPALSARLGVAIALSYVLGTPILAAGLRLVCICALATCLAAYVGGVRLLRRARPRLRLLMRSVGQRTEAAAAAGWTLGPLALMLLVLGSWRLLSGLAQTDAAGQAGAGSMPAAPLALGTVLVGEAAVVGGGKTGLSPTEWGIVLPMGIAGLVLGSLLVFGSRDEWCPRLRRGEILPVLRGAAVGLGLGLLGLAVVGGISWTILHVEAVTVFVVCLLATVLAGLLVFALGRASRRAARWAVVRVRRAPTRGDVLRDTIRRSSPAERARLMATFHPGSSMTPREYLELLRGLEGDFEDEPAASSYWKKVHEAEELVRQQASGPGTEPEDGAR